MFKGVNNPSNVILCDFVKKLAITCSKLTREKPGQGVKYVQS